MARNDLIRFVTSAHHLPYGHRSGVFAAAHALWREGRLAEPEQSELRSLLDWFNKNLAEPDRLAASRHPRADETALSWMRSSAQEHVVRLRRVAALVETGGAIVEELRTTRPGYVLYEDDHQVVALPFADTVR